MTGFPILMYYLWICLWFYDGQLVRPESPGDILPFLHRMWEHIRVVRKLCRLNHDNTSLRVACQSQRVRMEGLFWPICFPIGPCVGHARVYAGRASCPLVRLQNSHVQLQRPCLPLLYDDHCCGSPYQWYLSSHGDH